MDLIVFWSSVLIPPLVTIWLSPARVSGLLLSGPWWSRRIGPVLWVALPISDWIQFDDGLSFGWIWNPSLKTTSYSPAIVRKATRPRTRGKRIKAVDRMATGFNALSMSP